MDHPENQPVEKSPAPPEAGSESPFRHVFSEGFAGLLESLGISLLVTTYQAGKLMAVRARGSSGGGKISTLLRSFEQPMGLAVHGNHLAVGVKNGVWFLRNEADIAPQLKPKGAHDACWVPRRCHVTGDIRGHEMGWIDPGKGSGSKELCIVNTRFSCLCTLHPDYSFVPTWNPPFITNLAAEDRCHLNGLAMADGVPKYVTALGESNEVQGWRPNKATRGILMDVASGEIVTRGLSMPHSPRIYNGKLWVLNSGEGQLQVVDPNTGQRATAAQMPGYTRGLEQWSNPVDGVIRRRVVFLR